MSVVNLAAESTISEFVEMLLPQPKQNEWMAYPVNGISSGPRKALYIAVDLRISSWDAKNEREDGFRARMVHLIFARPTMKVWACVNNEWSIPDADKFKMVADHDSCWRELGVLSDTYLEMLDQLRESNCAFDRQHNFHHISKIKWVEIEWERDSSDNRYWDHQKKLTSLKELK